MLHQFRRQIARQFKSKGLMRWILPLEHPPQHRASTDYIALKNEQQQWLALGCCRHYRARSWSDLKALRPHIHAQERSQLAHTLIGYSFDPQQTWPQFASMELYIPAMILHWRPEGSYLILHGDGRLSFAQQWHDWQHLWQHLSISPILPAKRLKTETKPIEEWQRLVFKAQTSIAKGELKKIVLARQKIWHFDQPIEPHAPLEKHHTWISIRRGSRLFLSQTPEYLFDLQGQQLHCPAIAGTFSDQLSPSPHMQVAEHQPVADQIIADLSPLVTELKSIKKPALQLNQFSHLRSCIQAQLKADYEVMDLIQALHPTPAIAGQPKEKALAWLRQHEGLNRGWYGGGLVWCSDQGAQAAVLLRSALLHNQTAYLFAGAGITAYSDPEREWLETELKMQTVSACLLNNN